MLKRRRTLTASVLAVATALIVSGIAVGARSVTHPITGDISPLKLPKQRFQNAKIRILVEVRDSADPPSCSGPDPPSDSSCTTPPEANLTYIDFDNDIRFKPNRIPKCPLGTITGDTTAIARSECETSLVGRGSVVTRFGTVGEPTTGAPVKATVSAFNGQPNAQGNPTLILHVDPGFSPVDLVAHLVNSPQPGDYGKRLVIPGVSTGTKLTRFDTRVKRGPYVQARCRDRNRKLNFHAKYTYGSRGTAPNDYPASATSLDTDKCKLRR